MIAPEYSDWTYMIWDFMALKDNKEFLILSLDKDLPFSSASSTYHLHKNCTKSETIRIESGCEITNKRCQCWPTLKVCRNQLDTGVGTTDIRWHFKTLEDCQLNLQNLIKLEMEFDEDYTISPSTFTYKKLRRRRKRSLRRKTLLKQTTKP
ncbi:hypothetical protein FF38_00708 [Lucilia cuprina]|uniref:Uncharacterized protein n=1 Tax=Lucilia cuprina TaxID=7375 RepID=A0A0L0C985_LUCCU|nr:hypothetical protein FF38_00708 [Lucilia cuprina]